ncbi:cytochrome c oxidase subunit II [Sulfobacillus harzensis]|uniref:cytochrome-c oxidase n=1 Tax=Sulfobacillus harzensis TaxID=2729629 RepID=A0A7Y0Q1M0_9FIRM|nr:cytochrome c oxidase subunit II [Sulfobacillus harzensis]NMP21602.1 cytochrome c oxidase subunit II [Sulfobacillus harzensis]
MDIVIFGVVWIIISALGEWFLHRIGSSQMYFLLTNQGNIALHAFNFLTTMLAPVFLLVIWWLVWTAFRYHADSPEPKQSRIQVTKNGLFTTIWILGSIVLNLLFWLHPTAADLEQMFATQLPSHQKNDLIVDVTARQWEWIFSYPQYHLSQTVNANGQDELVIPAHKKIEFVLRSYDPFHTYDVEAGVIHSFWVPAFGIKEDVIPGETRYEYIVANRTATYQTNPEVRVQCAEVCGPGHPWMESPLKIVTASQFKAWIAKQQKLQSS